MKKIVISRSVDIYDSLFSNARNCTNEESYVSNEEFEQRLADKIKHLKIKYDIRCYTIKRHSKDSLSIFNALGKEILVLECFDLNDDEIEQYEVALEEKEDALLEERMTRFTRDNAVEKDRVIQIDFNEGARFDMGSL